MKRVHSCVLLLLIIACVAAAFRLPRLGIRPMHADESVQAARFRDLWQQGQYTYDPDEYHGPTLMYATLPVVALSGASEFEETTAAMYRLVPVIFGIGLVALVFLFAGTLGTTAVGVAALLAAISPAMVFYSRYYIHETLLVFFTVAALACGWRYHVSRRLPWCLLAGGFVGLMQATKETAAISYLAAGLASCIVWTSGRAKTPENTPRGPWPWQHLAAGTAVAIFVAVVFLSSFFSNWRGPVDGVLTYVSWLNRAGGDSSHIYPWSFHLRRLIWWQVDQGPVWSEGLILVLAVLGLGHAATAKRSTRGNDHATLVRWLASYTIAITAIYCLIPYKTPWCLLQFLIGIVLLAGIGAAALLQWFRSPCTGGLPEPARREVNGEQPRRTTAAWSASKPIRHLRIGFHGVPYIVAALLLVGAGHLAWQAYRASFSVPADQNNPYVFALQFLDEHRLLLIAVAKIGYRRHGRGFLLIDDADSLS
ncbi:MAG: TIGR03663 family protein [Pirellulaceae bacterium]